MIRDAAHEPTHESPQSRSVPEARPRLPFIIQVAGLTVLLGAVLVGFARWRTGSTELVWPYLAGRRLLFAPTKLVLGKLSKGNVVERELRVVNLSPGPLTLLGSQSSCGCVAIDDFPIEIPVGGKHHLRLRIASPRTVGAFEHLSKFYSDDKAYSAVVVTVSGEVQ